MSEALQHNGLSRSRRFSVAPMMDWTDRHCRVFHRLLTRRALLYTEMLTTGAVIHGDRARLLSFSPQEHPVALQLGGSEPDALAASARIGEDFGYDEINLNVGCPSDRVQDGQFGACLMAEPERVGDCIAAMKAAVGIPVTVKCRIGVDARDDYGFLRDFVGRVAESGCQVFVVHARIAVLSGLSPRENREVPPLKYEHVHRLKREFPALTIVLNGGIRSRAEALVHLQRVDGVMIGREAYHNPWILAELHAALGGTPPPSREAVVEAFLPYVEARLTEGVRLGAMTRHVLGLFQGVPGARQWRRRLSEEASRPGAGAELLRRAMPAERVEA
jgi:tRNA-dihydrouridine synthase A